MLTKTRDAILIILILAAVLAMGRYAPAQELPPAKTVWITFTGQDPAALGWPLNGWPWMENRARRMAAYYKAAYGWQIGIEFKNPWGLHAAPGQPNMRMNQRSLLAALNNDGRFDKALDMRAMSDCIGTLQRQGIPVTIYVGGPLSMPLTEGERLDDYIGRELTELAPILAIQPAVRIAIDNSYPRPESMSSAERVRGFLTALSAVHSGEVLCEPGYQEPHGDWPQRYGLGTVTDEGFFSTNILKNVPGVTPNRQWTEPAEIGGPIVVRHNMAATDKPWDGRTKADDPTKVAAFVAWIEKQLAAGYEPAANAGFFPGYGSGEAWK